MKLFGKYRLGFDVWALMLFIIIMIPNVLWFVSPEQAPLTSESLALHWIERIASIAQVVLIGTLCFIINELREIPMNKWSTTSVCVMIALYSLGWGFYYGEVINLLTILTLSVTPGVAFLIFSIARKNIIAALSSVVFLTCHVIASVGNLWFQ